MKYTIRDFRIQFPNDDVCLDYIFRRRYGHLEDFDKYYRVKGRKCYAHGDTGKQIHPLGGTIFHKSSTPLTLWFFAIYLFSQSRNGVSAAELQRQLGVTYKCAWRIASKVRELMSEDGGMLSGTVEADEMYPNSKRKKQGNTVLAMVERGGAMKTKVLQDSSRYSVQPVIKANIQEGSTLMTDGHEAYKKMPEYDHQFVIHTKKEWARGNVHVANVEAFFQLFKKSVKGTYNIISEKYLQNYLDEFSFRYTHRNSEVHMFHLLLQKV